MSSLTITAAGVGVFIATVSIQLVANWWRSENADKTESES